MDLSLHLPRAFEECPTPDRNGLTIWEMKQWGRHAAICRTQTTAETFEPLEYVSLTRAQIVESCRPNIVRGLAFGTVLEIDRLPPNAQSILDALDTRQRQRTVWQWAIVVVDQPRVVIGLHIWMRVALTNIFDSMMIGYREEGFQAATFKKDKDALMRFLSRFTVVPLPEVERE